MMLFIWITLFILILMVTLILAIPMLRKNSLNKTNASTNQLIFQEQILEIDYQLKQELIDSNTANELKNELGKKFLNDDSSTEKKITPTKKNHVNFIFLIPILTVIISAILYSYLGSYAELSVAKIFNDPDTTEQKLIKTLENWSKKKPKNEQAIYLLATEYLNTKQFEKAIPLFNKFYQITKSDQGAIHLAQALFTENNNLFNDKISLLIDESLEKNEFNSLALELKGIEAIEKNDYQKALALWQKAFTIENDPSSKKSLEIGINFVKSKLGIETVSLTIHVTLSNQLKNLPKNTKVIVYAQDIQGGMPLAVKSILIQDLPAKITLDDSNAMPMSPKKLSDQKITNIIAAISLTDDVMKPDYRDIQKNVNVKSKETIQLLIEKNQ